MITRLPFSSTRSSTPDSPESASVTALTTSLAVCALSSTSSRGAYCTPILTSTNDPPPKCRIQVCRLTDGRVAALQREARDPTPRQLVNQCLRLRLWHLPPVGEPEPRSDLGRPAQAGREQLRPLPSQPGVGHDRLSDRLEAAPLDPLEPRPDGRVVAQVRLEDQAERLALVVDEVEVRADRPGRADPVVGARLHRLAHLGDDRVAMGVEQG